MNSHNCIQSANLKLFKSQFFYQSRTKPDKSDLSYFRYRLTIMPIKLLKSMLVQLYFSHEKFHTRNIIL